MIFSFKAIWPNINPGIAIFVAWIRTALLNPEKGF
jgi:hypothetical protein